MQVPQLDTMKNSLVYLYDYLLQTEDDGGWFAGLPVDAAEYLAKAEAEAKIKARLQRKKLGPYDAERIG